MVTERQLNLLLIFLTANTLCVVLVNCCDEDDGIYVPSSTRNPTTKKRCPPPSSNCDKTIRGVCVVDPLCTGGIDKVVTWQKLSGCQRQKLRKERTERDLPNLLFLGNVDREKCAELSKKRIGIFGCCEKTKCRRKCSYPANIKNYPYNCGVLHKC